MKKLIISSVLVALASVSATQANELDTSISFQKSSEIVIKSDTALVDVIVNATALKDDSQTIQKSALQNLKNIIPKIDWKVVDFQESQVDSGAQNIKLVIQSRLTDAQIKILKGQLKNSNSSNSRFKVKVISFDPSNEMIDKAKEDMMIQMYQSIQQYVSKFNQQTKSNYQIHSVNYTVNEAMPNDGRLMNYAVTNFRSTPSSANQSNNADLTVSKKMIMNADVTLSDPIKEDDQASDEDSSEDMKTTNILPPKYLQVEGFQKCLQTKDNGSWQSWCLPQAKPKGCADGSWSQLTGQDIPNC